MTHTWNFPGRINSRRKRALARLGAKAAPSRRDLEEIVTLHERIVAGEGKRFTKKWRGDSRTVRP
jgi:hypothetical protein